MLKHHLKLIVLIFITACSAHSTLENKNTTTASSQTPDFTRTPALIYKTTKDYSHNVAVTLSADKSKIESYPEPGDVYYKGKLATPTPLANGYWLDNRGVSVNTAFTSYTYEEFSKLKSAPDLETFYKAIIDKNPITELYNCGNRDQFTNEVKELNSAIKNNALAKFKRIK